MTATSIGGLGGRTAGGGSTIGGSTIGGSTIGGSTIGGSTIGGSMTGGSTIGGSIMGGEVGVTNPGCDATLSPTELSEVTVMRYSSPLVNPVTETLEMDVSNSAMTFASLQTRTRYPVRGAPPLLRGTHHSSSAPPSVAVIFSNVGGSGIVAGVTSMESDAVLSPTELMALTVTA